MNLAEVSIRRPVLATMLSALLILFGWISYHRIALDRFPNVDIPVISILTTLPGADPGIIDSSITNEISSAVNAVPGIRNITANSYPSSSVIIIQFALDKNIDIAFNEVQAKVNQILARLPSDANSPVVSKLEIGSTPIMRLALTGDKPLQFLNQYASNVIKKQLETIDGIGSIQINGERKRTIRVELDVNQMAAFDITTQDLIAAFTAEHIQLPGGFLVGQSSESQLNLDLEFHNTVDLGHLIVAYRNNLPIHLKDVSTIIDGLDDPRHIARFNAKPALGIGIIKISGANTVAIINQVKARLNSTIRPNLPHGLTLTVASDDGSLIEQIIQALQEHLVLGTLLAGAVVLLFLRNIRSTLIIAMTIPVSLLGAVAAMYLSGFTFNILTLLGLLLLIGIVVDDAIVVLENIYHHIEKRETPKRAALLGSKEVMFAVLASTFTLVSIFVPVVFMGGIIGRFFQSFAVVVTVGVLISLFVALTMTPMLCAYFLKKGKSHSRAYQYLETVFCAIEKGYLRAIKTALSRRYLVVSITFAVIILSGFFFTHISKTFLPDNDEGRFIVSLKAPLGSNLDYTKEKLDAAQDVLFSFKEVKNVFAHIGSSSNDAVNAAKLFVTLVPTNQRHIKQHDLIPLINQKLSKIPGVKIFTADVGAVGGARSEPLQISIRGPSLAALTHITEQLEDAFKKFPELGKMDHNLQLNLPQERLVIDRERAQSLGLSTRDIATAFSVLVGGFDVAKYNDKDSQGERFAIRLKAKVGQVVTPQDISQIVLRSTKGALVRLDTVARLVPSTGPAVISRSDLQYAVSFFSSPSMGLGDAVNKVNAIAKDIVPPGYTLTLEGQAKDFGESISAFFFAMGMAVLLVYMVLASQFNRFIQPLVVMLAQPLAIIGGIAALWLTNNSLNIYSMLGMILLMGLVAKNSILLVDLTNQLRAHGHSINEALLIACPKRMRPVLMTSLTIVLAMLPAALGQGAGASSNEPLAVAVIGGMISSTVLTLLVVPAFYSLLEHGLQKIKRRSDLSIS